MRLRIPAQALSRARARRGYASLIGLLLVLVIICLLMEEGYFKKGSDGKTQTETYIGKGKSTACAANRSELRSRIQQMSMGAGGVPKANVVRRSLGGQGRCPEKGVIQMDSQGTVYCSVHAPAPEDRMMELSNLFDDDSGE